MTEQRVPATTDLCDAHPEIQVCEPVFQAFGGSPRFCGPITTLKVFEDNTLVKQAVEGPGEGRVLVVDGGGSKRCGLVGGNLAVAAAGNGWAGIVVYGCIRDADELAEQPLGVRALAAFPRRSQRGPALRSGRRHRGVRRSGLPRGRVAVRGQRRRRRPAGPAGVSGHRRPHSTRASRCPRPEIPVDAPAA
jgi:regulator of ribonuclease activity A